MATTGMSTLQANEELILREDGVDRWLIRGKWRERPMVFHSPIHAELTARLGTLFCNWIDQQPGPRGEAFMGNVGCRLCREPETTVGFDIVYRSPELAGQDPDDTTLVDGVPTLVVEILAAKALIGDVNEKIDVCLEVGVPHVWVINCRFRTVTIYRPGHEPTLVNQNQELSAEPHLPGFRVAVAELFR